MKFDKFLHGAPILNGNNTVPGLRLSKELKDLMPKIFQAVKDLGCDYPPTVVEKLRYDEISEVAAYGGFPVRYPHWKWGMEYEQLQKGYQLNLQRIYEMVINTVPCYLYCLESNSLLDDITVIAHALGHADFFKNNIFFSQTNQNMMNEFANHATRIRRYIARWGKERVTAFLDQLLRIETLIDPSKAWERRYIDDLLKTTREDRDFKFAPRLEVPAGHDYMDPYLNPKEWIEKNQDKIKKAEVAAEIGIMMEPTKDIFGFIRDNAPLKPWQQDIVDMLYEETMYFAPQRMTKTINEGFASWVDYNIMAKQGFASLGQKEGPSAGIIEYALHKTGVLGGKYSMNPYKLGFSLLSDIEDRWNKGRFGTEWENCDNYEERRKWDKNLGLGREKIFEVRKYYNDMTLLMEYFTADFCEEYEFFEWKLEPNGNYVVASKDHEKIKRQLLRKYLNGGLPEIKLVDNNHRGKGFLMLEHIWDGRELHHPYVKGVLNALSYLWKNEVFLLSKNHRQDELVYWCPEGVSNIEDDEKNVTILSRYDYEQLRV
jgi:stage V sporulation protein R